MQKSNSFILISIVIILATIGQIASDIYLPSIPSIALYFSTSIHNAELTIFYYTIGFSVGALIYGPLSDKFGRKKLIVMALIFGAIGTMVCALSTHIVIMFLGRIIQGLALSCCTTLSRAIVKDICTDAIHMAKIGSIMGIIYAIVVSLAPMIGGFIQQYWYWQITFFAFFVFLVCVLIVIIFKLPETNLIRHDVSISKLLIGYGEVIQNKKFISYNISSAMALGGLIAYLTAAPELLQSKIGLSPQQFGYTAFIIALALIVSGIMNNRLIHRRGINTMLQLSALLMTISSIIMLILAILVVLFVFVVISILEILVSLIKSLSGFECSLLQGRA